MRAIGTWKKKIFCDSPWSPSSSATKKIITSAAAINAVEATASVGRVRRSVIGGVVYSVTTYSKVAHESIANSRS